MNLGLISQIYFWLFKVKNIKYAVQVICGCAHMQEGSYSVKFILHTHMFLFIL